MTSTSRPTVTIFGSTGGSGLAILRHCLKASLQTTVLVRTPNSLLALLDITTAPSNLHIIQGDIRDSSAVAKALIAPGSSHLSDIVISGIGMRPPKLSFQALYSPFANADVHICRDGVRVIVDSIHALRSEGKTTRDGNPKGPLTVVYSTTGISDAGRDIPLHMVPLYWGMLGVPHKDKKEMEQILEGDSDLRWIIMRPSFLTGDGKGALIADRKVRVGFERAGKVEKRELGTSVSREACGQWVFENLVAKLADAKQWEGGMVAPTF